MIYFFQALFVDYPNIYYRANGDCGIIAGKGLFDSVISNVINKKKGTPLISGMRNMINVKAEKLVQAE